MKYGGEDVPGSPFTMSSGDPGSDDARRRSSALGAGRRKESDIPGIKNKCMRTRGIL